MSEERLKALEIAMELFGISGSPRIAATYWIIKEALRYAEEKWNAETRYFSVRGKKLAIRAITDFYLINETVPVGGGAFGANLGATFWSKDKGADGVKADKEGLKSLYKTLDRLVEGFVMMNKKGGEKVNAQ